MVSSPLELVPSIFRRPAESQRTPGHWTHRRHRGPHGARQYDVYQPGGRPRRGRLPVLVLLHGCRQSATEFAQETGFTTAADTFGFVIVAPRQEMQHQFQRCWRWYEASHQRRGAGEPGILKGIVDEVLHDDSDWRVDRRRVYVAGLSAGGSMALILATTYPDVFAAAGVHSATAYRSATQGFSAFAAMSARGAGPSRSLFRSEMAPVVLIHGTSDPVVRPPNADRIVDQWLASRDAGRNRGLGRVRPVATTRALLIGGRHCLRTRWYSARGRRVLEYWRIDGLGHAWSGGQSKGAFIDRAGPAAATVMWDFFQRHRLPSGPAEPERFFDESADD